MNDIALIAIQDSNSSVSPIFNLSDLPDLSLISPHDSPSFAGSMNPGGSSATARPAVKSARDKNERRMFDYGFQALKMLLEKEGEKCLRRMRYVERNGELKSVYVVEGDGESTASDSNSDSKSLTGTNSKLDSSD